MEFEWDDDKRRRNLLKHQIDFFDAKDVWFGDVVERRSTQQHHTEERFLAIGQVNGRLITVVYTWRGKVRRLISARKARRYEQEDYESETRRRP